jgi:hypothetical protein
MLSQSFSTLRPNPRCSQPLAVLKSKSNFMKQFREFATLAAVESTFDFMEQFWMFAALAPASGGLSLSR